MIGDSIERIVLRRVSRTLGFCDVRLASVNLRSLRVEDGPSGIKITPPTTQDRDGRDWPVYSLQPGAREAVEAEIRRAWARSAS